MSNPNDAAYPVPPHIGLTKRELFAAMAMQGLLSSPIEIFDKTFDAAAATLANLAVSHADALLAALSDEVRS